MKFIKKNIKGLFLLKFEKHKDNRGIFFRNYCLNEFKKQKINFLIKQTNISINPKKNTLRGFHYQKSPSKESKVINCLSGSILNITIDIRKKSSTYLLHDKITVNSKDQSAIYIPAGCANAFLTLEKNTVIQYFMGDFYKPKLYRGFRYDDPYFSIKWPKPKVISRKDLSFKKFK